MKISEMLIIDKKKIENPEHWTQGMTERDIDGVPYYNSDKPIFSRCSIGAMSVPVIEGVYFYPFLTDSDSLSSFNDNHTHAEVMALWDKAIALAIANGD
jgi:hypothetical protein